MKKKYSRTTFPRDFDFPLLPFVLRTFPSFCLSYSPPVFRQFVLLFIYTKQKKKKKKKNVKQQQKTTGKKELLIRVTISKKKFKEKKKKNESISQPKNLMFNNKDRRTDNTQLKRLIFVFSCYIKLSLPCNCFLEESAITMKLDTMTAF